MEEIILMKSQKNEAMLSLLGNEKPKKLSESLSDIEFGRRIKIVSALGVFSQDALRIINQINNMRNAFAHNKRDDDKIFNYKGKSIFELEGINTVFKEFNKAQDDFFSFIGYK